MIVASLAGRRTGDIHEHRRWRESGRVMEPTNGRTPRVVLSACVRSVRVHSATANTTIDGSGLIIQTGLVVTNFHLVEDPRTIKITVNDRRAKLLYLNADTDLAVLAVQTRRLSRVNFHLEPFIFQPCFYAGNPELWKKNPCKGEIMGLERNKIRINVTPAHSFSGSGLYDLVTGALLGVITTTIRSEPSGGAFAEATPARFVLAALKEAKHPPQPRQTWLDFDSNNGLPAEDLRPFAGESETECLTRPMPKKPRLDFGPPIKKEIK